MALVWAAFSFVSAIVSRSLHNVVKGTYSLHVDVDPGPRRDQCVVDAIDKFTQTCGGKGKAQPLSQEESTSTLALAGFYCFSGHITLRMILIYYVQVCFRQLQKTKERVLLIT